MEAFSFGKNWQDFIQNLDTRRFDTARASLQEFLEISDLKGKTFVDIGSGSGLFSAAAHALDAEKIVSFDIDAFSVECTRFLHTKAGNPAHWTIQEGSVLDTEFLSGLDTFDVVYAWGSLHHTGDMYQAIRNAAHLTKPKGVFMFAIYNKVSTRYGSLFWLKFKKFYNASPLITKRIVEFCYMGKLIFHYLIHSKNPFTVIRDFKTKRGMSWRHDIIDWLGGYPYEFATTEEIFRFMKVNFPDFTLVNIKSTNGLGNNQFLFRRS